MPIIAGCGVNYKSAQANWINDKNFFKSIKAPLAPFGIRPTISSAPIPWAVGTPSPTGPAANVNAFWRLCAQTFATDPDFSVTWGLSLSNSTQTLTESNWSSYSNSIINEATYLQSQGTVLYDFELGNELERLTVIPFVASTLTQIGGVASATTTKSHGLTTGDTIIVTGATPAGYNGSFNVTVTASTTFTYPVSAALSPFTSGNISCYSLTIAQLHINIRQLAIDVKAVYNLSPISYACDNFTPASGSTYTDWINTGLGSIDTISLHPYGSINLTTQTVANGGFAFIQSMITAFPGKCYISEFNLDSGATNLAGLNPVTSVSAMNNFIDDFILAEGFPIFLVYMWTENLNTSSGDYGFAQLRPNGDTNPMWFDFFDSDPTQYSSGDRADVSRSSVARSSVSRTSYIDRPRFNT